MTDQQAGDRGERFIGWELRLRERVLLVHGAPAKVGGRAFDLLSALVQRRGRLATKGELLEAVWPGLIVEENNLSVQVAALRKLLGSQSIANVAGLGYQLVAEPAPSREDARSAPDAPSGPASQRIFGRENELDALSAVVGVRPLVTIVGTGGVGKSTMARVLSGQQHRRWRDGVHWIDLAHLRPGESLLPKVADCLGIVAGAMAEEADDLEQTLAQQEALIVLDNCEHVLDDVAAMLGPMLRRRSRLFWLATSQEPLHLIDEAVYRLEPLEVPPPGTVSREALRFGAVALLVERARAVDRHFELDDARVAVAIDLCRRLDGLPLALEMAAARVATLGLEGVHQQLGERLHLRASLRDAPARHHTLRQTFEWSYGLLPALEQAVFRRLEPFAGGFTLRMAQHLCCMEDGPMPALTLWSSIDALSALVDKSLVQRTPLASQGELRLTLLESARDFARLRLEAHGELSAARRLHASVVADAFDDSQHELERWRDQDWIDKYQPERPNVCVALAWACQGDEPDLLARLVAALAKLDALAHTHADVVQYMVPMQVLEAASPRWRAQAYLELGWAHFLDGHREQGTELALRALDDFEALDDNVGVYMALMRLVRLYDGRPGMEPRARAMWQRLRRTDASRVPLRWRITCDSTVALLFDNRESEQRLRALHESAQHAGLDAQAAVCRLRITDDLLLSGRYAEAAETAAAMLAAGEPLPRIRAVMLHNRAQALVQMSRFAEALEVAKDVLRALPGYAHFVMDVAAFVALESGRIEDAALLCGCSAQLRTIRGLQPDASEVGLIDSAHGRIKDALGSVMAESLMRRGASCDVDAMLRLALSDT